MSSSQPVEKAVSIILKHPWRVLVFVLLVTSVAVWALAQVTIFTSRKALLPSELPVSQRMEQFLDKFGAASDLIVVVEGDHTPSLQTFASQLARALERQSLVKAAVERVDLLFFLKHAYLLVPPQYLERFVGMLGQMAESLPRQATWDGFFEKIESFLAAPQLDGIDMDLQAAEASLDLMLFFLEQWNLFLTAQPVPESISYHTLLARQGAQALENGYFASRDGKMLFVFVRPKTTSEEFDQLDPFLKSVRKVAKDLQQSWTEAGKKPPVVGLTGLPAATHEEFVAVKRDITFTISTALVLIVLLILLWLRSLYWALIVFVPMALGVVWNIGMAYVLVGHLTMITSGFTAILFGLGVDYGIFMSSRIIEERNQGHSLVQAIQLGVGASFGALLTAGGCTAMIFASLTLVDFSGFAELGIIAASGVVLVLLATFLIQPVLFLWIPPSLRTPVKVDHQTDDPPTQAGKMKIPRFVNVLLVVVALLAAIAGGLSVTSIPFDYDVMSLLPEDSQAAYYQRKMLQESEYQGEVVIFTAENVKQAHALAKRAEQLPAIARVQKITDLFPQDAAKRVAWAKKIGQQMVEFDFPQRLRQMGALRFGVAQTQRIKTVLQGVLELMEDAQEQAFSAGKTALVGKIEKILTQLELSFGQFEQSPEKAAKRTERFTGVLLQSLQAGVQVLSGWTAAKPLLPDDLPESLRDRFFGSDGSVAFYAFPAEDIYDVNKLQNLMQQVYSVSPQATGFPTTHHVFSRLVVDSYRQGTLLSILVGLVWIGLALRRFRSFIIASLPLLVGGGWMMGVMALLGVSFNFANIIGLPLVMGLAVDYGVWFAHRQQEFQYQSGWYVARRAGKAILLAAGTTLAGLGAITLASYRGVSSMGLAITIGLACCVAASLLVSPAITQLFRRS